MHVQPLCAAQHSAKIWAKDVYPLVSVQMGMTVSLPGTEVVLPKM
jgi:hypothetical protein